MSKTTSCTLIWLGAAICFVSSSRGLDGEGRPKGAHLHLIDGHPVDWEDRGDTEENIVHHQTKSKEQAQTTVSLETTLVELCDHLVTTFFHGDSSMTTF